jgi:hypothetical protein
VFPTSVTGDNRQVALSIFVLGSHRFTRIAVCVRMCICAYVRVYAFVYAYTHARVHVHVHVHVAERSP